MQDWRQTGRCGVILDAMEEVQQQFDPENALPSANILSVDRDAVEIEVSFRVQNIGKALHHNREGEWTYLYARINPAPPP
ncbi:hypothetical protein [Pararhizobium sp. PWRC1-1]|uniref:hypothetical protein n=1 Tax=Pararhizobium sp. PWRC1-1 TaxID=2804566 RepID=UPI003CF35DC0